MRIHIQLIAETATSSLSVCTIAGAFQCFILEDGFNATKIKHRTRILPGIYQIAKRTEGSFAARHKARYGHSFVPHLLNVPGFEYILIHTGNDPNDTSGCLLPGYSATFSKAGWNVTQSERAFLALFAEIEKGFAMDGAVEVQISRELWMGGHSHAKPPHQVVWRV